MSRHELPFGGGGRPPLARPCPRCGRVIGMSYGRTRYQQARHKNLAGHAGVPRGPQGRDGAGGRMTAAETLIEIASEIDDLDAKLDGTLAARAAQLAVIEAQEMTLRRIDALVEKWLVLGEDRK